MKTRRQSGFTLIELALVMGISIMVASGLIGMFQAHIQIMNKALTYKFLARDAPLIGLLLTRTIGNAEDFRIYATGADARSASGTAGMTGQAVKLWMAQPNGIPNQPNSTSRQVVISFEQSINGQGIYFFLADPITGAFSVTPNWELVGSSPVSLNNIQPNLFTFDSTTLSPADPHPGVLLVTLKGSYNDSYQFAAEKK
jgi:hypothetical protein